MKPGRPGNCEHPSPVLQLILNVPRLFYLSFAMVLAAAMLCKTGIRYSFNDNEGWNAFWAAVTWDGPDLYPDASSLKLNNYLPPWFYATGALGRLTGDNIQAGRILAGAALLLNAVVISVIVREITGRGRSCWFAGVVFLSISGIFYGDYAAINDPQLAANLFMTISILLFIRRLDGRSCVTMGWFAVALLLFGGLMKHNVIAVPISISIFLILFHWDAFVSFAARSAIAFAIACAALYVIHGPNLFSSVLFTRPYDVAVAWAQSKDQLAQYSLFLLVIPYLALQPSRKERFILVYSVVSLIQGAALSGTFDVDVNVFFDFAVSISIGLGLMENSILESIRRGSGRFRNGFSAAAWLGVALLPSAFSLQSGITEIRRAVSAETDVAQQADLAYIKSIGGHVICENHAFCYWAGKEFEVDLNNIKLLVLGKPELELEFIADIANCSYALIQLNDDWNDEHDGPFTAKIIDALERHYTEESERETDFAVYLIPSHCSKRN